MKQASLANMAYDEALGRLQLRKEALAAGEVVPVSAEKLASSYALRDLGNSLMDQLEKQAEPTSNSPPATGGFLGGLNPAVRAGLLGGGLGALGGLGKSWFSKDDDEESHWVRNMLIGGTGGAALGGGLGLMLDPASRANAENLIQGGYEPPPGAAQPTPEQGLGQSLYEDWQGGTGSGRLAEAEEAAASRAPEALESVANTVTAGGGLAALLKLTEGTKGWNRENYAKAILQDPGSLLNVKKGKGVEQLKSLFANSKMDLSGLTEDNVVSKLSKIRNNSALRKQFLSHLESAGEMKPGFWTGQVSNIGRGNARNLIQGAEGKAADPASQALKAFGRSGRAGVGRYLPRKKLGLAAAAAALLYGGHQQVVKPLIDRWKESRRINVDGLSIFERLKREAEGGQ